MQSNPSPIPSPKNANANSNANSNGNTINPMTKRRSLSRSLRKVSAPFHHHSQREQHPPDEDTNTAEEPIQIHPISSRPKPEPLPIQRSQTTAGTRRRSIISYSRLPTPTAPPKSELCSHTVYRKEGRRSVLSSLGRRCARLNGAGERGDKSSLGGEKGSPPTTQDVHESSPRLRKVPVQFPMIVLRRPSTQCEDEKVLRCNTSAEKVVPGPGLGPVHVRKVRERAGTLGNGSSQPLLPRFYATSTTSSRSASFTTSTGEPMQSKMASPKRIRLSRGFEDLRGQHTRLPTRTTTYSKPTSNPKQADQKRRPQQTQTQEQAREKENVLTQPNTHTDTPNPNPNLKSTEPHKSPRPTSRIPLASSPRRKIQIERTVSSHPSQPPAPDPNGQRRRRPILTAHANSRPQVETAMPLTYWLGRFVTLTNAFHYEDSFNEPDIATGFEMPSSYSRPFQRADGNLAAYRVKRAFMVLENVCATQEASASLCQFRCMYIHRFGDRWLA